MADEALQRVKHSIIFDKGLDTKTNPQLTEGYLTLENCEVYNVGLQKSKGIQTVINVPNADPANNTNVFSSLNQLAVVADQEAYAYDPLDNILVDRGSFASLQRTPVLTAAGNVTPLYYSEYGNYGVLVYMLGATTYLRLQNLASKITITIITFAPMFLSSEYAVGVIATKNGFFFYTQETPGGLVDEYFYPYTAQGAFPATRGIITTAQNVTPATANDASNYPAFKTIAIEYDDAGGYLWLFYVDASGNATYLVRNLYGNTVVPAVVIAAVPPYLRQLTNHISHAANLNSFFAGAIDTIYAQFNNTICVFSTQAFGLISSFALPSLTNPYYSQSICYCGGIGTAGTLFVLKEDLQEYESATSAFNSRVYPYVITYDFASATWTLNDTNHLNPPAFQFFNVTNYGVGFVVGSLWPTLNNVYFAVMSIQYEVIIAAGPLEYEIPVLSRHGNYYIIDYKYNLVDFAVHYLGSHKDFAVVTTVTVNKSIPLAIVDTKANRVIGDIPYIFLQNTQTEIEGGEVSFDNLVYVYDVAQQAVTKLVNFDRGQTGYFGISNMFMITQNDVQYSGFLDYPGCAVAAVPQMTPTTYYTYTVTYEYINANGELFRSAPAIYVSIAYTLTSGPILVYFTLPSVLEIKNPITIKVWRTTVNSQTFYLVVPAITYVPGVTLPFITDPGVADDVLIKNELAYFNGGVLGEIPFDPFVTFTLFNNRFFTVTLDNSDIIQYSLPYQPTVGMATTFGFDFSVEPRGGDIVELAVLDDKLIIFKNDFIFFIIGDGADALGNNSSISRPELINSPVGCSTKASVIRMPTGIMFQSAKGIWLLDRGLSVTYVGAPVEKFNDLTVTSATLSTTENKVRFTTNSPDGTILTYDYYYDTWKTDVGVTLVSTTTYVGGFYGMDTNSDLVAIYDGYLKKNQPYSMTIETPWIKLAGLQGFQRVYKALLLGNFINTNVLSLGISYDFVDQIEYWLYFRKDVSNTYGTGAWGAFIPFGGNEKSNFEINFFMPRQKCQSIKFTIKDGFDNLLTDNGNSFTITEIMFIAGIKSDSMKLPASRRV